MARTRGNKPKSDGDGGKPNFDEWNVPFNGILEEKKIKLLNAVSQHVFSWDSATRISRKLTFANCYGRKRLLLSPPLPSEDDKIDDTSRDLNAFIYVFRGYLSPSTDGKDGFASLVEKKMAILQGSPHQPVLANFLRKIISPGSKNPLVGYELQEEVFKALATATTVVCDPSLTNLPEFPVAVIQYASYFYQCICHDIVKKSSFGQIWSKLPECSDETLPAADDLRKEVTKGVLGFLLEDVVGTETMDKVNQAIDAFSSFDSFKDALSSLAAGDKAWYQRILCGFNPDRAAISASTNSRTSLSEAVTRFMTDDGSFRTARVKAPTDDVAPTQQDEADKILREVQSAQRDQSGKEIARFTANKIVEELQRKKDGIAQMRDEFAKRVETLNNSFSESVRSTLAGIQEFDQKNPEWNVMNHFESFLSSLDLEIGSILSEQLVVCSVEDDTPKIPALIPPTTIQDVFVPNIVPPDTDSDDEGDRIITQMSIHEIGQITEGFFTLEGLFQNEIIAAAVKQVFLTKNEEGMDQSDYMETEIPGSQEALESAAKKGSPKTKIELARAGLLVGWDDFHALNVLGAGGFGTVLLSACKQCPGVLTANKVQRIVTSDVLRLFVRPLIALSTVSPKFAPVTLAYYIEDYDTILEGLKQKQPLPGHLTFVEVQQLGICDLSSEIKKKISPKGELKYQPNKKGTQFDKSNIRIAYRRVLQFQVPLKQVLEALAYMQRNGIIHRDLKAESKFSSSRSYLVMV
jgi:hypothetical protein